MTLSNTTGCIYDVYITGHKVGGGTVKVKMDTMYGTTYTGSSNFTNWSNFDGLQLDYFTVSGSSDSSFNPSGVSAVLLNSFTISNITENPNEAPTVTASSGTASYTENDGPVVVDSGVTVSDSDNTTLASAEVSITGNFSGSQDMLSFTNDGSSMGNITASYSSSTGALTLNSSGAGATVAEWQAALRAVQYSNTSDNPSTLERTISFSANDGSASSAAAAKSFKCHRRERRAERHLGGLGERR